MTKSPSGGIPADTLGNRLMLARAHAGHLSIREAADRCGLGRGAWTNWERGARPADVLDVVTRVAEVLGVDRDWLMWGGALSRPDSGHATKLATPQEPGTRTDRQAPPDSGITTQNLEEYDRPTRTYPSGRPPKGPVTSRKASVRPGDGTPRTAPGRPADGVRRPGQGHPGDGVRRPRLIGALATGTATAHTGAASWE